MWLVSAPTALALAGAVAGMVALRELTELPAIAATLLGALGGAGAATLLFGRAAERLDASLHRAGGPRRRRR
jgi:hypothetical protein